MLSTRAQDMQLRKLDSGNAYAINFLLNGFLLIWRIRKMKFEGAYFITKLFILHNATVLMSL